MPQVDIKIATQYDGSGFSQATAGINNLQRQLGKKFALPDIGKDLLNGLGIGNGFALAEQIKNVLVKPFEDAAKAAEAMLASTEKSLNALEAMLKLRRTDAQELAKLRADDVRLAKEAAALNAPKFETKVSIQHMPGFDARIENTVPREATDEERKRLFEIGAARQELATQILALEKKITEEKTVKQKAAVDESIKANEAEFARQKEFLARQDASDAKYKSQLDTNQRNADAIRAQGSAEAQLAVEIAKVNSLRNVGNGLTDAEADAAIARLKAERQATLDLQVVDAAKNDLEVKQLAINQQLANLEGDFTRTDADKWAEKKKLQEDALTAAKAYLAVMVEIRSRATTEDAKRIGDTNVRGAAKDEGNAQAAVSRGGADPNSFIDQIRLNMTNLNEEWGTMAQQMGDVFKTTISSAVDGISRSISGLVKGTMTWGMALRNIGSNILSGVIDAISRMFAQWAVGKLATFVLDKTLGAASAAAAVAIAAPTALALSALWVGPATLASIASFGAADAAGTAGIAASLIATKSISLVPGYDVGGYTPGGPKNKPAGVVHAGEWVAPQWMTGSPIFGPMIASLEGARSGGGLNLSPNLARPDYGSGGSRGGRSGASGDGSGDTVLQHTTAFFDDRESAESWLKGRDGVRHIIDVMQKHSHLL